MSPAQSKANKALQWDLDSLDIRSQKTDICGGSLAELGILLVKCSWKWQVESQKLFGIFITALKAHWQWELPGAYDKRVTGQESDSDNLSNLGLLGWFTLALMYPHVTKMTHLGVKQQGPCLKNGGISERKLDCKKSWCNPQVLKELPDRKEQMTLTL